MGKITSSEIITSDFDGKSYLVQEVSVDPYEHEQLLRWVTTERTGETLEQQLYRQRDILDTWPDLIPKGLADLQAKLYKSMIIKSGDES